MTDYFVVFGDFLVAIPTYLLNGVLATVYWLGESGAALVSILCAALIIRFVDQRVQSRAAFRPGRGGRESLSYRSLYCSDYHRDRGVSVGDQSMGNGRSGTLDWGSHVAGRFDHRPAGAYARAYLVVERKVRDNDLRISRHRQQVVSGLHSPVIRGSMGSPDRHFRKRCFRHCQYPRQRDNHHPLGIVAGDPPRIFRYVAAAGSDQPDVIGQSFGRCQ